MTNELRQYIIDMVSFEKLTALEVFDEHYMNDKLNTWLELLNDEVLQSELATCMGNQDTIEIIMEALV